MNSNRFYLKPLTIFSYFFFFQKKICFYLKPLPIFSKFFLPKKNFIIYFGTYLQSIKLNGANHSATPLPLGDDKPQQQWQRNGRTIHFCTVDNASAKFGIAVTL